MRKVLRKSHQCTEEVSGLSVRKNRRLGKQYGEARRSTRFVLAGLGIHCAYAIRKPIKSILDGIEFYCLYCRMKQVSRPYGVPFLHDVTKIKNGSTNENFWENM